MSRFLQHILASSPAIIYVCKAGDDFGGTYISSNITDLFGYSPDEFLSDSGFWKAHVHPGDLPRILTELETIFSSRHQICEYRFRARDGGYRWVRDEMRLASNPETGQEEIVGSWLDITDQKHAERALRDNESYLREALQIARLGRWRWDIVTGELDWSTMMKEIFGLESLDHQLTFADFAATVHPDDRARLETATQESLANRSEFACEHRIILPDGSIRHILAKGKPFYDADGKPTRMIGTTLDVTGSKKVEADLREAEQLTTEALQQAIIERDKTKAILDAMADGISIQDPELRVVYQNAAHRKRMGNHLGDFCYRGYQQREDACPGCHLVQSFADGQVHIRETTAAPYGELHHFQIVSTPLFDPAGRLIAGIEAVRDITARKKAEEELQRKTTELEDANRELEAFSYTLSHDLRSYLSRISLAAESLQESDAQTSDTQKYLLQSILGTCQSMDELIATMLTLARISRQELQITGVDLSAMAENICGELALANSDRALRFDIAPGLWVSGDPNLLQVALENLFGNACKYTRGKDEARISLRANRQNGKTVFAIADNGAGFDMAEVDKLFRPFQRLSNARAFPGFGIGLTTVQRIIRRHGGEIWAEGVPGEGATFHFTLPGQID